MVAIEWNIMQTSIFSVWKINSDKTSTNHITALNVLCKANKGRWILRNCYQKGLYLFS